MSLEGKTPASHEPGMEAEPHRSSCPRCDQSFPATDEMLDHLSSHLRHVESGQGRGAAPSMLLGAMPTWQVDAALADLETSMRRPRVPHLVRMVLTYAVVMVVVLAGVVLVVAGRPVLGLTLALSAVLLADGRLVRHLGRIRRGREHGSE